MGRVRESEGKAEEMGREGDREKQCESSKNTGMTVD